MPKREIVRMAYQDRARRVILSMYPVEKSHTL